jgi:transcriptional regulator with XRE-family HTH domain
VKVSERSSLRRRAGLTQVQLGRRVNISASQICLWERGDLELSTLDVEHIARVIEAELAKFPAPSSAAQIVSVLSTPVGATA